MQEIHTQDCGIKFPKLMADVSHQNHHQHLDNQTSCHPATTNHRHENVALPLSLSSKSSRRDDNHRGGEEVTDDDDCSLTANIVDKNASDVGNVSHHPTTGTTTEKRKIKKRVSFSQHDKEKTKDDDDLDSSRLPGREGEEEDVTTTAIRRKSGRRRGRSSEREGARPITREEQQKAGEQPAPSEHSTSSCSSSSDDDEKLPHLHSIQPTYVNRNNPCANNDSSDNVVMMSSSPADTFLISGHHLLNFQQTHHQHNGLIPADIVPMEFINGGKGDAHLPSPDMIDTTVSIMTRGDDSYVSKMSTAGIMASPTIVTTRHYCSTEGSSTSSDTRNSRLHGIRCYVCRRILKVPQERDKRLASSYPSFIVGRILGLGSSVGLLVGLFLRFVFLDNDGPWKGISYFIIAVSIMAFAIGALLVIWATLYKSAKVRREMLEEKKGMPGPSSSPFSPIRPSSTLSSSSFQSHSSATAILPPQRVKSHPVGSINC